jgi:hypothetical protein
MASLPELPELREVRLSTELAVFFLLLFSTVGGLYAYNYFAGAVSNPSSVFVETLDKLAVSPIIQFPSNDPPANVTLPFSYSAPETSGTLICLETWFFWPGNSLHPANDWEPAYIVWDTGLNPVTGAFAPRLEAVITRYHAVGFRSFSWVTRRDNFYINGTQPVVKFSVGFHIPLTGSTVLFPLRGLLYSGPYTTQSSYNYTIDPNSPPATGPQAYQSGSGPADCLALYGSPTSNLAGLFWGSWVFAGIFGVGLAAFFGVRWVLERIHELGFPWP